jgi:cardiolipin synthase
LITTIPNIITLFRIATVPVLILLLHDRQYEWALLVFFISGVSDGIDGYIAKTYHMESELGGILDPLADKALIFSSYLMLMLLDDLPFWLFLTVIFRDLLILVGSLLYVALNGQMRMEPSYLSKLNTFTQIILVVAILGQRAFELDFPASTTLLVYVTAVTTIVSGAHYLWKWIIREEVELVGNSERNGGRN